MVEASEVGPVVTLDEAAALLRVSRPTLYRLVKVSRITLYRKEDDKHTYIRRGDLLKLSGAKYADKRVLIK